jgi:hypothetical protein
VDLCVELLHGLKLGGRERGVVKESDRPRQVVRLQVLGHRKGPLRTLLEERARSLEQGPDLANRCRATAL